MDEQGYVYFQGRMDDIINVGGEKISPTELEDRFRHIARIDKDFCIIGCEDETGIYGSVPLLCVIDEEYSWERLAELNKRLLDAGLKDIFVPKDFAVVKEIPKTHN